MKIFFIFIIGLFFSFSKNGFSQDVHKIRHDEIQKQINEMLRQRDEFFKSLLDDSNFENFDKRFEDLIKNFEKENLEDFEHFGSEQVFGEYDWKENLNERIFSLKIKQIKDKPLDIKISKGQIKIKGEIESKIISADKKNTKITRSHFERSFSLPDDVIQSDPVFENKDGEILIRFKKSKNTSRGIREKQNQERLPLDKSKDDLTI